MSKNPRLRKTILRTSDVDVPRHLDLYQKRGVTGITIKRITARQIYIIRLSADESTRSKDQEHRRLGLMKAFARTQRCPTCSTQIALGRDGDPECVSCHIVLYPPPSSYLMHLADSYLDTRRDLRDKSDWASPGTGIFLAHHAAELYLKALGAYSVFANDGRDEYLYGPAFDVTDHDLARSFRSTCPIVQPRLGRCRNDQGQSVEALVDAIPRKMSEVFRYGLLLRDATDREIRTTTDGDVVTNGVNLTRILTALAGLLRLFATTELKLLELTTNLKGSR